MVRRGTFYYRISGWESGAYKSLGIKDDGTAKTKRLAMDAALERFRAEDDTRRGRITMREWASRFYGPDCPWLAEVRAQGRSITARTIRTNVAAIKKHILPLGIMSMQVAEITRQDARAARDELVKRLGQTRTNLLCWDLLRRMLTVAHAHDMVVKDPTAGLGTVAYKKGAREALTPGEIAALFGERPGPWDSPLAYSVFMLAYLTGMRRSEILAMHWDQINNGVIRIDRAWKDSGFKELGIPKSRKTRVFPITGEIRLLLLWWQGHPESVPGRLVFHHPDGKPLGTQWWKNAWNRATKKAGVTGKTPHCLRHTIASDLAAAGMAPDLIRLTLGWSGEAIRENYTHADPDKVRAALEIAMRQARV